MLPIQVINIVDGFVEAFDSSRPAPIEFRKAHQRAAEAMIRRGSDTPAAKVYLFNASLSSFLEERTQLIWDRLKEAVAAVDLEPYSDLNSDLKAEIAKRVNPTLQAAKAQQKQLLLSVSAPTGAPLPNDLNLNNIPAKIYAEVDLFCAEYSARKKQQSEAAASSNMNKSKGTSGQYSVTIFISHSAKDEALAKTLVELLRAALNIPANKIRCTSVNGYRLPAGASIDDQLRQEVHESQAFIGLITPSSMASTFVLFELGARWGAGRHLVPLLGAGADSSFLRGPLGTLNALRCDDVGQIHQLVDDLANLLSVVDKTTPAGYQAHIDRLVEASKANEAKAPVPSPPASSIDSKKVPKVRDARRLQLLKEIREGTLRTLSVSPLVNGDVGKYCELREQYDLGQNVGEQAAKVFDDLGHLLDLHFDNYIATMPPQPRLDHKGRPTDFHNLRITSSGRNVLDSSE